MTDQPIIYWQDDSAATAPMKLMDSDLAHIPYKIVQNTFDGSNSVYLTRDQARSLGYALIARATVTSWDEEAICRICGMPDSIHSDEACKEEYYSQR
jgi:hypothetical protein